MLSTSITGPLPNDPPTPGVADSETVNHFTEAQLSEII
jgi:hypothetical protein